MSYAAETAVPRSTPELLARTQNEITEAESLAQRLDRVLSRLRPPQPQAVDGGLRGVDTPPGNLMTALERLAQAHSLAHKLLADIESLV